MLIGVLGFILGEEVFSMSNICFLDPIILGVRVTFPCDEVFGCAAFSLGIQNCLDFPFFFAIDNIRRGFCEGITMCCCAICAR